MPNIKKWPFVAVLLVVLLSGCALDEEVLPDDDAVSSYLGVWSVIDNEVKTINYEVVISKNPGNSAEILLDNFAQSGDALVGLVTGNTVTIANQTIGNGWTVSGTGRYISSSRLEFTYALTIGGDETNNSAIFTR